MHYFPVLTDCSQHGVGGDVGDLPHLPLLRDGVPGVRPAHRVPGSDLTEAGPGLPGQTDGGGQPGGGQTGSAAPQRGEHPGETSGLQVSQTSGLQVSQSSGL